MKNMSIENIKANLHDKVKKSDRGKVGSMYNINQETSVSPH